MMSKFKQTQGFYLFTYVNMAKLTETKKVLYFKVIHNLDIRLTNYPKRCPSGLVTTTVI